MEHPRQNSAPAPWRRGARLAFELLSATAVGAQAQGFDATSPPFRTPLVELYSSEGCSSCPPADQWLSHLRGRTNGAGQAVALEFHVDYWDSLGWKDRFAQNAFTRRQYWSAAFGDANAVYTPEVFVSGHELRNWRSISTPGQLARTTPAPVLTLHVALDDPATIVARASVGVSAGGPVAPTVKVFLALWQDGLESAVARGENGGRSLRHDGVVRALSDALSPATATASFIRPPDFVASAGGVTAFLQDVSSGEVLQAVSVPFGPR